MKDDPLAAPPPSPLTPVDLADPEARQRWLVDVRAHLADLTSAALEATGPKRRRILSRAEFRRAIKEAGAVLVALLDAAGPLEPTDDDDDDEGPPEPDDPGYGGDHEFSVVLAKRSPGGVL